MNYDVRRFFFINKAMNRVSPLAPTTVARMFRRRMFVNEVLLSLQTSFSGSFSRLDYATRHSLPRVDKFTRMLFVLRKGEREGVREKETATRQTVTFCSLL